MMSIFLLTHTREGSPRTKIRNVIKDYIALLQQFNACLFAEVEKCGFVRKLNARRFYERTTDCIRSKL